MKTEINPKSIAIISLIALAGMLFGAVAYLANYSYIKVPIIISSPKESVVISTDKAKYAQAEIIRVALRNNYSASRFVDYPVVEKFENNSWIPLRGSIVWLGCWVTGGMPYLPLESRVSYDYQWNQKEKWCNEDRMDLNTYSQEVGAGKYRIKTAMVDRTKSSAEDPNNISGKPSGKIIYSNEFIIEENSKIDPRCGQKVTGIGSCKMIKGGYEFDASENKCIRKNAVNGCSFEIPFDTLEDCQKTCETGAVSGGELKFETIAISNYFDEQTQKSDFVIKDQSEWIPILQKISVELPAPIDFSRDMVIAVFQGEKSTGGYSIEIDRIIEKENSIEVSVLETSPGPGCMVTQAFTSPYHVVKIKKSDKEVKFKIAEAVNDCN